MSTKLIAGVIVLTLPSLAHAYVLRTDSTGAEVQWKQAVTFVLDSDAAHQLGDGALKAVQASASQLALAADVGVTVKLGKTHGVGFSNTGENENAIVLLKEWPFSHAAIASTVITVDAVSHQILDADVALNGSTHSFGVLGDDGDNEGDDAPTDDIENTTTHELGHAMGLMHNPNDATVVMYPSARQRETSKRTLKADDKAGLVALYPPGSAASGVPHGCTSAPGPFAAAMLLLLGLILRRKPAPVRVRSRRLPRLALAAALTAGAASRAAEPVKRIAEGKVIATRTLEPKAGEKLLFTEVTVQISKCHGARAGCEGALKFTVPGGKWGRYEQSVTDQPVPQEGEPLAISLSTRVERVFHLQHDADRAELNQTLLKLQKEESCPK